MSQLHESHLSEAHVSVYSTVTFYSYCCLSECALLLPPFWLVGLDSAGVGLNVLTQCAVLCSTWPALARNLAFWCFSSDLFSFFLLNNENT